MEEVLGELVFPLFELLFANACLLEDGDVEGVLLALEQVQVHEVDDLARVLPGPGTQDSGAVHGVGAHVVIEQGVEVHVGHATHLSLQTTHLKLSLVVHLPDQLLPVLKFHAEFPLLLAKKIRSLVLEVTLVVGAMDEGWGLGGVHESLALLVVVQLVL